MAEVPRRPRLASTPEQSFTRALKIANDPDADLQRMRFAAETLVAFGAVDEADRVIERLEEIGYAARRLKAVSRHLRKSGILTNYRGVAAEGDPDQAGPREVLVARASRPTDRVIFVFSGLAKRFWISLELLNRFLEPHHAHIVNLSDYSGMMYFTGLPNTAPGYPRMLDFLRSTAADLGARRFYLLANSGGGFIGLRAAADLEAESFLGLSIRTDFSPRADALNNDFAQRVKGKGIDEGLLIDMRPYLADRPYPRNGLLVCGDGHPIDLAHARHLADLPRFDVIALDQYKHHDAVSGLLARGQFESVLARFMGGPPAP